MEKKLLFVTNVLGFMTNAITNNLAKYDYTVEVIPPDMRKLEKLKELPSLVLIYLDGIDPDDSEMIQALVFIRDKVVAHDGDVMLFTAGNPDEIERFNSLCGEGVVSESFKRPINVKELAERLDYYSDLEQSEFRKKHILVIDDDVTMLTTIKGWLEGKYQVYVADGGMSGISLLARHSVDLILLDYEMPIVTGAKVLELIRSEAETADIPVIFLTSKSDKDTVMSVMALKPVKYLLKTSPKEDIVKEIDDFFMKEAAKKVYIKK